ncbi:hypothetical protein HMI56_001581 [Coelomomyces lativittatus]|nr:hypothetical protein HMI56_001581 [Coelomomyces lativittatus]
MKLYILFLLFLITCLFAITCEEVSEVARPLSKTRKNSHVRRKRLFPLMIPISSVILATASTYMIRMAIPGYNSNSSIGGEKYPILFIPK